jgi:hypothetical protein|nr:MAG TPA_asm: hypothetical protein [Caudoviricetes sp.]
MNNNSNNNNNNSKFTNPETRLIDRLGCAGLIFISFLSIAVIIFTPVIAFGIAYFIGWIMSLCIGDVVANGLNMIFATDRFTPEVIPLFYGTMGLIGSFFRKGSGTITNEINEIKKKLNSKVSED